MTAPTRRAAAHLVTALLLVLGFACGGDGGSAADPRDNDPDATTSDGTARPDTDRHDTTERPDAPRDAGRDLGDPDAPPRDGGTDANPADTRPDDTASGRDTSDPSDTVPDDTRPDDTTPTDPVDDPAPLDDTSDVTPIDALADTSTSDVTPDTAPADATADTRTDTADTTADTGTPGDACPRPAPERPDPATFCTRWHEGSLLVTSDNAADWATLRAVDCVRGSIAIERQTATRLDLSHLRFVRGNLLFGSNLSLQTLDLSGLVGVDGEVRISTSAQLVDLDLSALRWIGSTVRFESVRALRTLSFPVLESLGSSIHVGKATDREQLERLDAPRLAVIAGIQALFYSDSTTIVSLPALRTVGAGRGTLRVTARNVASETCDDACNLSGAWADCFARCGGESRLDVPLLCDAGEVGLITEGWTDAALVAPALRALATLELRVALRGVLSELELGALATVSGFATIALQRAVPDTSLQRIDLPALRDVGQQLSLAFGPGATVDVPLLTRAPNTQLSQTGFTTEASRTCTTCESTTFSLPALPTVVSLEVEGANLDVHLGALVDVTARLRIEGSAALDAPLLDTVAQLELERFDERSLAIHEGVTLGLVTLSDPQFERLTLRSTDLDRLVVRQTNAGTTFRQLLLPNLEAATELDIMAGRLVEIDAPALALLDVLLIRSSGTLVRASFPLLETLVELDLQSMPAAPISLPRLTRADEVSFFALASPPDTPALTTIGKLVVSASSRTIDLPTVTTVTEVLAGWSTVDVLRLPAVDRVERMTISGGAGGSVSAEAFPALRTIDGTLMLDSIQTRAIAFPALERVTTVYARSTRLESIDLPVVVAMPGLTLQRNNQLAAFSAPRWDEAQWVTIEDNPLLGTCALRALVEPLFVPPPERGRYCIRRNNRDCTDACP